MLWTDKGSEFISKHFKDFLKRKGIKLYHTENEELLMGDRGAME